MSKVENTNDNEAGRGAGILQSTSGAPGPIVRLDESLGVSQTQETKNVAALKIRRILENERAHVGEMSRNPGLSADEQDLFAVADGSLSRSQSKVEALDKAGFLTVRLASAVLNSVEHKLAMQKMNFDGDPPAHPLGLSVMLLESLHHKLDEASYHTRPKPAPSAESEAGKPELPAGASVANPSHHHPVRPGARLRHAGSMDSDGVSGRFGESRPLHPDLKKAGGEFRDEAATLKSVGNLEDLGKVVTLQQAPRQQLGDQQYGT